MQTIKDIDKKLDSAKTVLKDLVNILLAYSMEEVNYDIAVQLCHLYFESKIDNLQYMSLVCACHIARVYRHMDEDFLNKMRHIAEDKNAYHHKEAAYDLRRIEIYFKLNKKKKKSTADYISKDPTLSYDGVKKALVEFEKDADELLDVFYYYCKNKIDFDIACNLCDLYIDTFFMNQIIYCAADIPFIYGKMLPDHFVQKIVRVANADQFYTEYAKQTLEAFDRFLANQESEIHIG